MNKTKKTDARTLASMTVKTSLRAGACEQQCK